jgi:hypothetical protein
MTQTTEINWANANFMQIIPQWSVSIEVPQLVDSRVPPMQLIYRVGENDLDAFLHVLVYNRVNFHVTAPGEHGITE